MRCFRVRVETWLFAVTLFAAALFLFTRENRFPFYYHPDEPGKAEQIQTAEWNYHHPMLMLSTVRAVTAASSTPGELENGQHVVETGRFVSAAFCAGAVVLLSLMLWLIAGPFAALAAGVLLLTNHQLFELAHYFKEDTSLLFGISAWFFTLTLYWKRPSIGTAALLGIGAALSVSGKYLGAFAPLLSLVLIPFAVEKGQRGKVLAAFGGTLAFAFALINWPIVSNLAGFEAGLDREMKMVIEGQRGTTRSVPHDVYLTAFQQNVIFFLWVPLLWYYITCWKRRRKLSAVEWTLTLFPIVFLAILSFSPKTNDRYFLPATALFLCGAALGVYYLRKQWPLQLPATALIVGLALVQLPDLVKYYRAFRKDDLTDLTAWLNTELPNAKLAVDRKVMLPTPKRRKFNAYQPPVTAEIIGRNIESFADADALRAEGVTHIVLSESAYGRYQLKSLRPQPGAEETHRKAIRLYRELQDGNQPLWKRPRSTVIYLHPGLEVYELPSLD